MQVTKKKKKLSHPTFFSDSFFCVPFGPTFLQIFATTATASVLESEKCYNFFFFFSFLFHVTNLAIEEMEHYTIGYKLNGAMLDGWNVGGN